MKFLHFPVRASPGDVVQVSINKAANVRLVDSPNLAAYRSGRRHRYFGGYFRRSPVRLAVPHTASWHVLVDLGGHSGAIAASVDVLTA